MFSSRISIGLAAALIVAAVLMVYRREGGAITPEPKVLDVPAMPSVPSHSSSPASGLVHASSPVESPAEPVAPSAAGPDEASASAGPAPELARIDTVVVTYAVESLPALAVYLTHADAEVRQAAREGFLQMGLTEGAAYLRAAADKIRDPREAVQLLDAADFLDLPSLPVTGGPALIPVSPKAQERLARERAARGSGLETRR